VCVCVCVCVCGVGVGRKSENVPGGEADKNLGPPPPDFLAGLGQERGYPPWQGLGTDPLGSLSAVPLSQSVG
jgi:hypothetical protein